MFGLLKRLIFDEHFARRAIVVTALATGGFLATKAGADATAMVMGPEIRGLVVLVANLIGGAAAVQGNGGAKKA